MFFNKYQQNTSSLIFRPFIKNICKLAWPLQDKLGQTALWALINICKSWAFFLEKEETEILQKNDVVFCPGPTPSGYSWKEEGGQMSINKRMCK